MNNKYRLFLITGLISLIFLCSQVSPSLAYIESCAYQNETVGIKQSSVWAQTDVIFNADMQGGVTVYYIVIYGRYEFNGWGSDRNRIRVHVGVAARYEDLYSHTKWWDPAPTNLVRWDGHYSYAASPTDYTVTWTYGASIYGYSVSAQVSGGPVSDPNPDPNTYTYDDYRWYGCLDSICNHPQEFTAKLQLHVWNDNAKSYYYGYNWIKILKLRFRLQFDYYYAYFWGWKRSSYHTLIMGDGSPSSDVSTIALKPGTVP
ncbi:MAG: hypothetical protein ACFFC6_17055 [Promethearchaeota archaeon]